MKFHAAHMHYNGFTADWLHGGILRGTHACTLRCLTFARRQVLVSQRMHACTLRNFLCAQPCSVITHRWKALHWKAPAAWSSLESPGKQQAASEPDSEEGAREKHCDSPSSITDINLRTHA